jgi:hypothetical protein
VTARPVVVLAAAAAVVLALPLIIVVLFLGTAGGSPAMGAAATSANVPAAASESGTLSCTQLESLWEKAGGSPSAAFLAAEVARAESGGQQYATDADSNGTVDEGYWQINTSHGALATYNALGNAQAAVEISGDGTDWSPWVTFQHGAEVGQC